VPRRYRVVALSLVFARPRYPCPTHVNACNDIDTTVKEGGFVLKPTEFVLVTLHVHGQPVLLVCESKDIPRDCERFHIVAYVRAKARIHRNFFDGKFHKINNAS
jgi:hypothetical protein